MSTNRGRGVKYVGWLCRRSPLLLLVAVLFVSALPALAQGPAGSEFQVNSYTTDNQYRPSVTTDANGDFVVVWQSYTQDGSSAGVFGQRYASNGSRRGSDFQVNSFTQSVQQFPSVATDADGDFVVVWQSLNQDGSSWGVFGQRYASNGSSRGSEFQVNSFTNDYQFTPSVATDADGDFVVVWESVNQDGSSWGIFGQRYASDGSSRGSEFQVNSFTASYQRNVSVATDADGDFVVVWRSVNQDGSANGAFGQRYSSNGSSRGSEFQVNSFTTNQQLSPSVATDADGDFVVVWWSLNQDGSGNGVFGQRYASNGSSRGSEFQVNSYTTSAQQLSSAVMDADGDFVVVWESSNQDGNFDGIFGQRYASDGSSRGSEFQVNSFTTSEQARPSAAMDADGDFVVVWQSQNQDGNVSGVFGQRFLTSCSASQGLSATLWTQISLPCDPGASNTVQDVFGDDLLPGNYGAANRWIVYERDEATDSNTVLTLASPLVPRDGYWIKSLDAGTLDVSGTNASSGSIALVGDGGGAGKWNMAGHPYGHKVKWAEVRLDYPGFTDRTLAQAVTDGILVDTTKHHWNGAAYQAGSPNDPATGDQDRLLPWEGFWMRVKQDATLKIPATPAESLGQAEEPGGWWVRLTATSGALSDPGNFLGVRDKAREGRDIYDLAELEPFADDYLTIVFPQSKWASDEEVWAYTTDYHPLESQGKRRVWDFEVRSGTPGREVTISWEGPEKILGQSVLVDRSTRQRIQPKPDGTYTFRLKGSVRQLRWIVGRSSLQADW